MEVPASGAVVGLATSAEPDAGASVLCGATTKTTALGVGVALGTVSEPPGDGAAVTAETGVLPPCFPTFSYHSHATTAQINTSAAAGAMKLLRLGIFAYVNVPDRRVRSLPAKGQPLDARRTRLPWP